MVTDFLSSIDEGNQITNQNLKIRGIYDIIIPILIESEQTEAMKDELKGRHLSTNTQNKEY